MYDWISGVNKEDMFTSGQLEISFLTAYTLSGKSYNQLAHRGSTHQQCLERNFIDFQVLMASGITSLML